MYQDNRDCGAILKQINDVMEKNANNALRSQDLTMSQAGMLIWLDETEEKSATFKELEKAFRVSQPTIVGIIKRLEQKGWIKVQSDASDKRIRIAQLTESGREKCQVGYEHMAQAEEELLRALSEKERREFIRLLIKVKNSIQ